MKKYIIISILLFVLSVIANSQTFNDIKPNEAFQYGSNTEINFVSPKVIYCNGLAEINGNPEWATIKTIDAGQNWIIFLKNALYFKVFFGEDTIFGNSLNTLYYTSNGFKTYDSIVFDKYLVGMDIYNGNNIVYLTTYVSNNPDTSATYRSLDYGENWAKIINSPLQNINFVNDSFGYAKYWNENLQKWHHMKTVNNGISWIEIPNSSPGLFYFEDAIFNYFTVDNPPLKKGFLVSVDEGKTWKNTSDSGLPTDFISGVSSSTGAKYCCFIDKSTGFAFDRNYGIYKTIDGGENWSLLWNEFQMFVGNMEVLVENSKVYILMSAYNQAASDMYYGVFDSLDIWSSVEVENTLTNNIQVFPNPAKEEVNIQTSGFFNMNTSIRVYDAAGKQVLETKLQIPQTTIDISGLEKGIYFIKVLNGDGEFVEKLIKD